MSEKKLLVILFHLTILNSAEAILSTRVNLPRCAFVCGSPKTEDDKSIKKIKDIYWRDFYGVAPPDAFPLGNNNQHPQTYVGVVFDPSHNGTFVTTIVEGQNYVYGVLDDKVSKITQQIQILCTMEPEKLIWKEVYNVDQVEGYFAIQGGFHNKMQNDSIYLEYVPHYVVKTLKNNIVYAGYSTGLNTSMTYALMDGTPKKLEKFVWLLFGNKSKKEESNNKPNSFFNFNYNINVNSGSIIPQFHNKINIGSCTLVCTNRGKNSTDKEQEFDKRSNNAMVYYWKPYELEYKEDALKVGVSFSNKTLYIGQSYTVTNWLDVGDSGGQLVYISSYGYTDAQFRDFQILSSNYQEKLEWINSTTNTFGELDKTKLVPGGHLDNGTETFVGRSFFVDNYKPGSIRVLNSNQQEKLEWVNATSDTFRDLNKSKMIPGGKWYNGTETFVGRSDSTPASVRDFGTSVYSFKRYFPEDKFQLLIIKD